MLKGASEVLFIVYWVDRSSEEWIRRDDA